MDHLFLPGRPDADALGVAESDMRFRVDGAMDAALVEAWPAMKQQVEDGWLLRRSAGHTRRANAVYPLHPGAGLHGMEKKVEVVEKYYVDRKLRPMFRLTPATQPEGLDRYLADRGYAQIGRTWVLGTGPLAKHPVVTAGERAEGSLQFEPTMSETWFDLTNSWLGYEPKPPTARRELLSCAAPGTHWATWRDPTGHPTAAGMVVVREPWAFVPLIVSDHEQWSRGHRIALLVAVMHALREKFGGKVREMLVEVDAKDELGRHLVESLCFEARYPTWYRAKVFFSSHQG